MDVSYSVSIICKEYYLKKKSLLINALFIKHTSALKKKILWNTMYDSNEHDLDFMA